MVLSQNSPDLVFYKPQDYPNFILQNIAQPVDKYIDFNDDNWSKVKEINDQFLWNGQHYLCLLYTSSVDDRPANVMLRWGGGALRIMTSHDCEVRLRTADFFSDSAGEICLTGKYKNLQRDGGFTTFTLFEGELVEMVKG